MAYNLDDQVAESFEFTLKGHNYRMRYPNTEDIQQAQKFEEGSQQQLDWLYDFITPVEDAAPPIREALSKANVIVLKRFNAMIKAEFTADE